MIKLLVLLAFPFFHSYTPVDSLGVEMINGKTFVIHKVDEKETLYAISKRYGTTVEDIVKYNPQSQSGLEIGLILKVPYVAPKINIVPKGATIHTVGEKETLYSISRKYDVTIDELKQWNNLTDEAISIGQELVIKKKNAAKSTQPYSNENLTMRSKSGVHTVAAKETLFSIARQYNITMAQLREWNNLQGNELKIGQVLMVVEPEHKGALENVSSKPQETSVTVSKDVDVPSREKEKPKESPLPVKTEETQTITISESVKGSDEILESGLAELIEGTEGNRKYLALHRTAPIGTILKVRNEMNNREVFVRVMGKLPDTAMTDKLIIKVSKSAYDRLGAIDPRFRVQVTYYK